MRRLRVPRVHPVELWDLPVFGGALQTHRHSPHFPAAVAQVIERLRRFPPGRWTARARDLARGVAHVHLLGGGVTGALAGAVPLPCTVSEDPVFAAARAGQSLLGSPGARCVDIGQTSIKVASAHETRRIERDPVAAPFNDTVATADRPAARASTVAFLAEALACDSPSGPTLLALPCELDDALAARDSTYCWADPDPRLLPELVDRAGLAAETLQVLNDGELAALAAVFDPQVPRSNPVLVLTVGFAVGGAILEPV
jgi:hypothetical protein